MTDKTLFTAYAIGKGGRGGSSQTVDGKLSFEMEAPGAAGKKPQPTTNPEELFACGYAACFGSALEAVAGKMKLSVEGAEVKTEIGLHSGASGYYLSAVLDISIPGLDQATAESVVEAAHQVCPYSKATRGNIEVTLRVGGQPLAHAA